MIKIYTTYIIRDLIGISNTSWLNYDEFFKNNLANKRNSIYFKKIALQ